MANRAFDNHQITLYSNLMEWLHSLNMRSAPAKQWLSTIQSAKGIREDEIHRSGLVNFLIELESTQKVNKSELLDIAQKGLSECNITIRTERTTTYSPELQSAAFTSDIIPQKVLNTFADAEIISCHKLASFNYKIVRLKFTNMFGSGES